MVRRAGRRQRTRGHDHQAASDIAIAVQHAEDAGGEEEALVVGMRGDDEEVFGAQQLRGQQARVAAEEVGQGPLQQQRHQHHDKGDADEGAAPAARGHEPVAGLEDAPGVALVTRHGDRSAGNETTSRVVVDAALADAPDRWSARRTDDGGGSTVPASHRRGVRH